MREMVAKAGSEKSMRDLLAEACAKLKTSFADQPLTEARLRSVIGRTYRNLELYEQAEQQLPLALEIQTRLLGETDPETIRSLNELARLRLDQDRLDEAEALNARALATGRRALGSEHKVVLQAMHVEADITGAREEKDKRPLLEPLLEIERRVLGEEHPDTLSTMAALAKGDSWSETTAKLERVLDIKRRVLGDEHPDTLASMHELGAHHRENRVGEAARVLERTLEAQRRVLGEDHPATLDTMHQLGHAYCWLGRVTKGLDLKERGLAARRRLLGEEKEGTLWDAGCLADEYRLAGRTAESVTLSEQVLAQARANFGEDLHTLYYYYAAELGSAYVESGRPSDAVVLLEPLLPAMLRKDVTGGLEALGAAYRALGRAEDARRMAVDQLDLLRRLAERPDPSPDTLREYASALLTVEPEDLRDPAAALPLAERANEMVRGENPEFLDTLALAYYMNGDTPKAVQVQRQAIALLPPEQSRLRAELEANLAKFEAALEKQLEGGKPATRPEPPEAP
jgi:tetratricopeptide (TPR) repeat protein